MWKGMLEILLQEECWNVGLQIIVSALQFIGLQNVESDDLGVKCMCACVCGVFENPEIVKVYKFDL